MVDSRLPAEWLGSLRIDKLSDRAFRVLAGALMWCNGQGTDGAVPARYTKYLHPDGDDQDAFSELEAAGLWLRVEDGYLLERWTDDLHQSTAEEIQRYRDASRRRQKAYRDRQRGPNSEPERATVSETRAMSDVTHNATHDVTASVGSGSLGETKGRSAYSRRDGTSDVTHNRPRLSAPNIHLEHRCPAACARARTAFNAQESRLTIRGWDCGIDGHMYVADGSCAMCELRPGLSVA